MIYVMDVRDALLKRVGVAVYMLNLVEMIIKTKGSDVKLILLGPIDSDCPFDLDESVQYLPIAPTDSSGNFVKIVWYYRLPRLLRKLKADLYFGMVAKLPFRQSLGCPLVVTVHDTASISTKNLVGNRFSSYKNYYLVNGYINEAAHVICISEYCRMEFSTFFGERFLDKSSVIYHGLPQEFSLIHQDEVEQTQILDKHGISGDYIFSLGTVTPKKNYERLIAAFAMLNFEDLKLVICGGHSFESGRIMATSNKLGVEERVFFLGSLPTREINALLRQARCFVFPSLHEGFGIPLLEAFYLGIPVVSSNSTCLPEIADDAALFFDPYEVEDITDKIKKILTDDALRKSLICKGMERVKLFDWTVSSDKHLNLFDSIATRRMS